MSSWLWGTSPVDDLVDKATSENLPAGSEDLALNLEICDQIRSKQVTPKDACRALKRRIGHSNPNVQLLALNLTDVCVKNGGHHFLVEIASHDFIDNLVSILKSPSGVNYEVKNKILSLIQTWGQLFRGKQSLGYVVDTYMILQHEGFQFPPSDNIGAALVESEAPPDWTDSDVCTRCRTAFTLTNRKHHCRACGSTFCGQCSSKTMPLPNIGINQDVRVCDGCYMKRRLGNKSQLALESHGLSGAPVVVSSPNAHSGSKTLSTPSSTSANKSSNKSPPPPNNDDEDEDLRRAIEESLKIANSQPGYVAPSSTKRSEPESTAKSTSASAAQDDEEDAELLAAIEASLREAEAQKAQSNGLRSSQRQSSYSSYSSYSFTKKPVAAVSANELTETEKSNIEMFAQLVDRIQMTQGDVTGNRELQSLYEQISKLQMKVALSLEDASKKQQEFIACNEKIDQAVKMYDHLLQERLNNTYQRRVNSSAYMPPGPSVPQGYGTTSPPQTPQAGHVYPRVGQPTDSRYSQYVPTMTPVMSNTAPYPQQQQPPVQQSAYQPYQPQAPPALQSQGYPPQQPLQQQTTGPQVAQPYASAPYVVSAPTAPTGVGNDISQGPPGGGGGFQQQQQQQQPFPSQQPSSIVNSQPFYPPTSGAGVAAAIPPSGVVDVNTVQVPPASQAPVQVQPQLTGPVANSSQPAPYGVGYAPSFDQQQPPSQFQQPVPQQQQQQPVYAAAPPQPKVEEAPLIEL
ncbi:Vacuolar protein-sorting-associated protein 27 [Actinomortierella wolfii]|nr:Vacuolar protein-sorting-associated protein 27 [Actinomortierella wolfii]